MALAETDQALGRQAVDRNLITEQQLQECLRLQQALSRPASLGALLVRRGYLTEDQCSALSPRSSSSSQHHQTNQPYSQINGLAGNDQALANQLVSSGTIQADTLDACIRDRGVDASGQPETLANVLVRKQLVAPETLRMQLGDETLSAPQTLPPNPASSDVNGVTCQACGSRFRALAEHYGHTVPCPGCGSGISVSASSPGSASGPTTPHPPAADSQIPWDVETLLVKNSPPGQALPGYVRTGSPTPSSHTPTPGTRDGADAPRIDLRGPAAPPGSRPSEYPDPGKAALDGPTGREFSDPSARDGLDAETMADITDPIARVFGRRVGADGEVTTFGPYDVLGEIARGGMGIVYRARQRDLKRIVALKILKEGEEATERQIRRFKRETAAAAKLTHPNIVTVHEVGCHAGFHYFTMDLIEGQPLDQLVKEARPSKETHADGRPLQPGGLDVEWSLKVVEQVATAIHYAHSKKVIHRDLKPANILMDREGLPKVTDFGLAKDLDHKSLLTRTGAAVGTPFYMAPEQARGDDKIDQRIDVYALGVILYEMLTGTPPFKGTSTMEIYHRILEEEPRPARLLNANIPRDAETICLKAIEKEPRRRYQTAQQLADDIKRHLTGEPITARPVGAVERLVKQARKNLPVVATVAVALLVLVPSLVAIVMQHRSTQQDELRRLRTEALTRFGEAITESHLNAEAILATAQARLRDPAPDEALEEVDEVIAQLNSLDEILEEHLRATEEGILERADLEKRLDKDSAQTNALYRSAHVVASAAEHEIGTEAALNRALERLEQALRFEDYPPAHHQVILIQLELGRADQALDYADDLLARIPDDHNAQRLRGRVLRHLGRHEEAVEALQAVVQRAADPLPARIELGDLLLLMGRPEPAKHEFENVLDQDDDSFEGYLGRGRANSAMRRVLEALDDYNDAVDLQPLRAEGYYHRGRLQLDSGRTGEAHKDFDIATARDDRFYPAWLGLGVAQVQQLKWNDAQVSFQRITKSSDQTSRHLAAEAWYRLASLQRLRTDIGSAVQERIDARTADATINILELSGRVRNLGNQRQPSEEDLDDIAKELTDQTPVSMSLEEDLKSARQAVDETLEEASAAYAMALELDPLMVEAPLGFAELMARLGRLDEAREALKSADVCQRRRRDLEEEGASRGSRRADAPLEYVLHTGVRIAFLRAWIALSSGDANAARDEASLALDSPPPETFSDAATGTLFECMMSAVMGLAHWQLGEADEANRLLKRSMLLSRQPDQPLGRLLDKAEKNAEDTKRSKKVEYFSRARAFYTQVIDYCPLLAQAYLGRARLQAGWPGYDGFAEKDFSKVIELAPFLPEAWVERGEVHLKLASVEPERLKLAEADFTRGIDLLLESPARRSEEASKQLASAHVGRARTRRALKDAPGAIEDARIASVLAPHDEEAYKLLVELHERAHEPVLALAARMEQAAIRAASRAKAQKYFKEGQVAQRRRSYPEAIAAFDEAIRLDPEHSDAFYERGVCYIKIGTFVPGILDLSRALELNPDLANILYEKVYQISYVVDLDRLIGELNKIVADHPDVAHVVFLRGYFYVAKTELRKPVNTSDIERGIRDLNKTLEINPKHLAALVYRGMLNYKSDNIDRAMQDYELALTFHDKFSMAHYLKAQAHAARDERELMLYHLKLSFDNGFNGFERVKRDPVFAKHVKNRAFRQIVGD